MRIVFLIRSLGYGGSERQLSILAQGLSRRGHSVSVVTLYSGGPFETGLRESGVRLVTLGKRSRWDLGAWIARLATVLREERPDVLHGYLEAGNILSALARPFVRGRIAWSVRASDMDVGRYGRFMLASYRLERALARFADVLIANSAAGRAHAAAQGFPAERIVVIPNGIPTDVFRPDPVAGRRFRNEWRISESERVVALVGRIDPMKDPATFLRAAAVIAGRRDGVRFALVGSGPPALEGEVLTLAKSLGLGERLVRAPARPEMTSVYNACDLVVSSSAWGEGFPNVLAEAMACGIPCVATDVGDVAAIVPDPQALVPPSDSERLANAIEIALDEPLPDERSAFLRQRIVDRYGVERLIDSTEAALNEIVS